MTKHLLFRQNARQNFKLGLDALANAVRVTLGPRGRHVAIERSWGAPLVTKDGVTVAEQITLASKPQDIAAALVKEVAQKTNEQVGDGTTTATVLAQALYTEGLKLVEAGIPAMDLKRGIDKATAAAITAMTKAAHKAEDKKDVARIGTISANGDERVGQFLADAFEKIGRDGVVTVEESQAMETTVEVVEGMEFDRGYISPYFITDQKRLKAELKEPYVLVAEKKITNLKELLPVLEAVNAKKGSLLVICEAVEGEALAALTLNKLRGVLSCAAVKAPGFGDRRKEMIKDIAALVGAIPFTEDLGRKVASAELRDLGRCDRAVLDQEKTQLIGGRGKKEDIKARVEGIRRATEETNSTYDKDKLKERLARLSGGVAVIRVGGATDIEVRERKHRVEDALAATRSALKDGFTVGGGVAFIRAIPAVAKVAKGLSGGEQVGARLVESALQAPLTQIVRNAGLEAPTVLAKVKAGEGSFGFDAQAQTFTDLFKAGVIDPVMVSVSALRNASSIVGLMLTTEALIYKKPVPKPPAPPGAGPGMGPGMGGMGMGGMGGMGGGHDDDFDM